MISWVAQLRQGEGFAGLLTEHRPTNSKESAGEV
jgi:hypothetical protein